MALSKLQKIASDEETTIQALLVEGINGVFERRSLSLGLRDEAYACPHV